MHVTGRYIILLRHDHSTHLPYPPKSTHLLVVAQKGNAARRNLLAGLAIIPFGAAAYWISRPIGDEDEDEDATDMLPFDNGQTAQMADRKPRLVWLLV